MFKYPCKCRTIYTVVSDIGRWDGNIETGIRGQQSALVSKIALKQIEGKMKTKREKNENKIELKIKWKWRHQ